MLKKILFLLFGSETKCLWHMFFGEASVFIEARFEKKRAGEPIGCSVSQSRWGWYTVNPPSDLGRRGESWVPGGRADVRSVKPLEQARIIFS